MSTKSRSVSLELTPQAPPAADQTPADSGRLDTSPASTAVAVDPAVHVQTTGPVVTVLVVEEAGSASNAMTDQLSASGYRVLRTSSTSIAFEAFVRERASLAVIDYDLVGADSTDMIRRLREVAPALPIILRSRRLETSERPALIRALSLNGIHHPGAGPEGMLELVESAMAAVRGAERLRGEQDARGLALVTLLHNLRSPLHVVRGYTELLQDDPAGMAFYDVLERVAEATDVAIGLIHDYLDVARFDTPGQTVESERVEIDELLDYLRSRAAQPGDRRPLQLTTTVAAPGAFMYTDADKLCCILDQLLANASQLRPTAGVQLAVRFGDGHIDFIVSDRGPDLGAGDAAPFAATLRRDQGLSSDYVGGQDVGLAVAQRLSVVIGATLRVAASPQDGALFSLRVPGAFFAPLDARAQQTLH